MSNAEQSAASSAPDLVESTDSILETIFNEGIKPADDIEKRHATQMIETFIGTQLQPGMVISKDTQRTIDAWMSVIDKKISEQLNLVMHHEDFQKLEASWRGLHYLVHESETGTELKIKVLNVSKKDLLKDLENAAEFDQSALFKKVYGAEYDQFGGHPFGCLIGDYEFGKGPQDISLLERIAEVASAAHAPFLSAAAPQMFGRESFTELGGIRDIAKVFDNVTYAKWASFRESEDSRYVGLTMPHTLMRLPYGRETKPVEEFNFEEDVDGRDHKKYLWGNAAYALGTRITESFAMYGWLATIRGVENGGLVQGLPVHNFETDDGEVAMKCPVEVAIGDRREKELSDAGFIPLIHCKNTDYAAFFATQSCQKPKKYDTPEANANAKLSTALQYLLCVSRFAHYLKAMARDKIGSFMEREDCERWLNRWINNYTLGNPEIAGPKAKAERPLREAKIVVQDDPSRPGCYEAQAFLRPHFQLEELSVGLSLVAKLPEAKGS